jgi:hypothetical protein
MTDPTPSRGSLVPLPPQPTPWPTDAWPTAAPPAPTAGRLSTLLDEITGDTARFGTTYAVAVVQGGVLLAEDTHDPALRTWRARMVEAFRAGS